MPAWLSSQAAVVVIAFGMLLWRETRRPLRDRVERRLVHTARNVAVGIVSAATVQLAEAPVVLPVAAFLEGRGIGLLRVVSLPAWLEILVACVLMDYTLYVWHVLSHKRPFLWRFHLVHHADLDLDASTAVRFHFGELLISIPWRIAQIALIGTTPRALVVWQTATLVSILFHHSNVELPLPLERALSRLIVTPRMHGIHHSVAESEVNSNWSSGLALWDRIHGTFRLDVPQRDIVIGVPQYRAPSQVSLTRMIACPFRPSPRPQARVAGITPDP